MPKRKKDQAVYQIKDAFDELMDLVEAYRGSLEEELAAARAEDEPYQHLIRALERQLETAGRLEETLDEQVLGEILSLANGSAYVEHTRTRSYF